MEPSKEVRDGKALLLTGTRLRERGADPEPKDAAEVTEVAGDELEVVMECRGGNLEIGVGQDATLVLEVGLDSSVDPGDIEIVRDHSEGRKDPGLDVPDVPPGVRRTEGPLEQLADNHSARELVGSRDRLEPAHVLGEGLRLQDLGDRVGIEEIRHSAVQPDDAPRPRSPQLRQRPDEALRSLPASGQGSQASTPTAAPSGNVGHAFRRDQHGDRLAMPGNDHRFPALGLANALGQLRLSLGCRHRARHTCPLDKGHFN